MRFSLRSLSAERVELCLVDATGLTELSRTEMRRDHLGRFSVEIDGIEDGQPYGFRVHGPFNPREGLFHNPNKILLDPYARAVIGELTPGLGGAWSLIDPIDPSRLDCRDSLGTVPISVVSSRGEFDWGSSERPPLERTGEVIYEVHVKGATADFSALPEPLRGTYMGLGSPPFIAHLKSLGVTAVELLPIFEFVSEPALTERGLVNFWGYNPISYFAPDRRYGVEGALQSIGDQFKEMVRSFHEVGLKVILDVVFNHTGEGSAQGPTVCFRGIDNRSYYLIEEGDGSYINWAGTGNTFNVSSELGMALVLDSLRYWVKEYQVDGFRYDLASGLAQRHSAELGAIRSDVLESPFFLALRADPVLRDRIHIMEPWDATYEGQYQGRFESPFSEWNGPGRDVIRRFWSDDRTVFPQMATVLCGSEDLYRSPLGSPARAVNFVTCHDGFTLVDLVLYREKHNLANLEGNADGSSNERMIEVPLAADQQRSRHDATVVTTARAALASVLLSLGSPMILYGDEYFRTQEGNNNAYCQDAAMTRTQYEGPSAIEEISRLVALRRDERLFSVDRFLRPRKSTPGTPFDPELDEVEFFCEDGQCFDFERWHSGASRTLSMMRSGSLDGADRCLLLMVLNPSCEVVDVVTPEIVGSPGFTVLFSSDASLGLLPLDGGGSSLKSGAKSVTVLTVDLAPERSG